MSAPQTNLEKQKRWHRGPLIGMIGVIVFVGVMFMWLTGAFGPEAEKPGQSNAVEAGSEADSAPDQAPALAPAPAAPADAGN
jgi:hypothetical protein